MKRLFLFAALFAAAGCAKHVSVKQPQPCEYVTAAPGVTPTPCGQVRELFEAAQRCYTANVDPAVARIQLEDVVVVRMPADGVTDSGSPWIWAPDGTKVYGYFSPDFNFIGYHFAPVLLHEFMHKFATVLHPETAAVIGHNVEGDALLGVDCGKYYGGEWK